MSVRFVRRAHVPLRAAIVMLLGTGVPAQPFEQLTREVPLPGGNLAEAIAHGDVDGDGDADLVFAALASLELYLNDGRGRFTDFSATHLPAALLWTWDVALADVDGDGDLDLLSANLHASSSAGFFDSQDRLYLNDGTGRFSDVTRLYMPVIQEHTFSLDLGDVDGDGDLDLVAGHASQNRLYLNDGSGRFRTSGPALPGFTGGTVALGDADGDGDPDLAVGAPPTTFGWILFFLNDGSGRFTEASSRLGGGCPSELSSVDWCDYDADGDLDLFCGGSRTNCLFVNNGGGTFSRASSATLPTRSAGSSGLALGDVDGDGDIDVVDGIDPYSNYLGQRSQLLLNDGNGRFAVAASARLPADPCGTNRLALVDTDGDGDLDLVGASTGDGARDNRLWLNDGSGHFSDPAPRSLPAHGPKQATTCLAVADVDGNGSLDILRGNTAISGSRTNLFLNDGGIFRDATAAHMPVETGGARAIAAGDMDGDGDLDLVLATRSQNRIYINDGRGAFADRTTGLMPTMYEDTGSVALGDVDGDGDLDVVFGNENGASWGGQDELYLNDGTGKLSDVTAAQLPIKYDVTRAVAFADVDNDRDLDLLLGLQGASGRIGTHLFVNDGAGFFTDVSSMRLPRTTEVPISLAPGDVDGDGDVDLICGNTGQDHLFINDGAGSFWDATASSLPATSTYAVATVLVDIDEDGDPDLLSGSSLGVHLYHNDGRGIFSAANPSQLASPATFFTAGDLDGDGDIDIVGNVNQSSPGDSQTRLYRNLQRQAHSLRVARPGTWMRIDLYGSRGPGLGASLAYPLMSTAARRTRLPPFGTFGLDPLRILTLPIVTVPYSAGRSSLYLRVPSKPRFVGTRLYTQALVWNPFEPPSRARFTNVVSEVITK